MSKIIRLSATNYKRLKAVEIDPDGNIVEIRGKNGAGIVIEDGSVKA